MTKNQVCFLGCTHLLPTHIVNAPQQFTEQQVVKQSQSIEIVTHQFHDS